MLDKDIEFCEKQIKLQEEKCNSVKKAMDHAKFNYDMAATAVEEVKKEKVRIGGIYKDWLKKFRHEEGMLNELRGHLRRLKEDKRFLKKQHKCVEEGTCSEKM